METKYLHSKNNIREKSRISNFDEEYDKALNTIKKRFKDNPDCTPIFIAIVGSVSYGLDLETSDIDCKGVYVQHNDSILSELKIGEANPYNYKPQLGGKKKGDKSKKKEDIALFELGRYLDLIQSNNPNILELLNTPEDCIIYEHPIWKEIKEKLTSEKVLTKKSYYTFYNYAIKQIEKAKGLNKKINNPVDKKRKTPLDFCYVIEGSKSYPLNTFLKENDLEQLFCGMVKIPNAKDMYSLYYDETAHLCFSESKSNKFRKLNKSIKKLFKLPMGKGYKGILKKAEQPFVIYNSDGSTEEIDNYSNEIRLSSVPKDKNPIAIVSYNKDGNSTYNKKYKEFWGENGWIHMRNEERYNDNTKSGQDYDGKNMSHCVRLLQMSVEIAEGKGVIVERNEKQREELLNIKKGGISYDEIMNMVNFIIYGNDNINTSLKDKYDNSNLKEKVDLDLMQDLLLYSRKEINKKSCY